MRKHRKNILICYVQSCTRNFSTHHGGELPGNRSSTAPRRSGSRCRGELGHARADHTGRFLLGLRHARYPRPRSLALNDEYVRQRRQLV